jgi:hypothetical protein
LYKKSITLDLYGNNPEELQSVAAFIYKNANEHDFVIGGKTKRKVTIFHESIKPKKVFDGLVG